MTVQRPFSSAVVPRCNRGMNDPEPSDEGEESQVGGMTSPGTPRSALGDI